jgi:hypothetical protein
MAYHSYLEFRGVRKLEADGALDLMVGALKTWAQGREDKRSRWLAQTSQQWLTHMSAMPPGLRDLVLDNYLATTEQEDYLARAVWEVLAQAGTQGPGFLRAVCVDLLELLGRRPSPS